MTGTGHMVPITLCNPSGGPLHLMLHNTPISLVNTRTHTISLCLSIYSPKSDTCKVCDSKIKVDAESDESHKRDLTLEWKLHKVQAESSYQQLKEDSA